MPAALRPRRADLGVGGGRETALGFGIPFLGAVPIDPTIVRGGDAGAPYAGHRMRRPGKKPSPPSWPPSSNGWRPSAAPEPLTTAAAASAARRNPK
jgi:hypothetical protein